MYILVVFMRSDGPEHFMNIR